MGPSSHPQLRDRLAASGRSWTGWLLGLAALVAIVAAGCQAGPHEAEALIRVDPGFAAPGGGGVPQTDRRIDLSLLEDFIATEVRRFGSLSVLECALDPRRVHDLMALDPTAGGRTPFSEEQLRARAERIRAGAAKLLGGGNLREQAARLAELIQVEHVPRSLLIAVRLRGDDRQLVADLVNSVVDSYMLAYNEKRRSRAMHRMAELDQQFRNVRARLRAAQNALTSFKDTHKDVMFGAGSGLMRRLAELDAERTRLSLMLISRELAMAQFQKEQKPAEKAELSAEMKLHVQSDPHFLHLRSREADLLVEKAGLPEGLEAKVDPLRSVEAQLKEVLALLETRRRELAALHAARRKEELSSSAEAARAELEKVNAVYQQTKTEAFEQSKHRMRYNELLAGYDALREEWQGVNKAITGTQIAADVAANNVSVYQVARVPPPLR